MWRWFWCFGTRQKMYAATDCIMQTYQLASPPPGYAWAQLDADGPFRLWQLAD